jgi:hypothetical protein
MQHTTEIFIERAKEIHGDKYDYSKVNYTLMNNKVCIICKEHGEFMQSASKHFKGQGCRSCGYKKNSDSKNIPYETFLERATKMHGNKYKYVKESYKSISTKIKIICPMHGEFMMESRHHYERGSGCKNCSIEKSVKDRTKSLEQFIQESKNIHGDKYDYSKVNYINSHIKVIIICKNHGEFEQKPSCHLYGGCRKCADEYIGKNQMKTQEAFIEQAKRIHGDEYDYSLVNYQGNIKPIQIICKNHGIFERKGKEHIGKDKSGCPKCRPIYHSKISIEWLNYMKVCYNTNIQHIGNKDNDGEHRIKNSLYHADGYCKETNTIFEFEGSYFHGDPKKYKPTDINKRMDKTFGELYQNTLKKKDHCLQNGYNFVECWESDWRRGIKALIKIQRTILKRLYS